MKKKILFILPSLKTGGTEKVMVTFFNQLDRNLFDPYFCALSSGTMAQKINEDSKLIILNSKRVLYSVFNLLRIIDKIKPDAIFSSHSHLNALLGLLKKIKLIKTRLVFRESNYLSLQQSMVSSIYEKYIITWLIKFSYKSADHLICQTQEMKEDIYTFFPSWDVPTSVIHNPITHIPPFISDLPKKIIITIGRLEKQKNHKLLILAYNKIKDVIPHNLVIIGEGRERSKLEQLIDKYGLKKRVFLKGFIEDPWLEYKNSALFVLTSNYEGFPNVLIEAMANSTTVISSDCPSGPKEIIQHGVNGLLFPVKEVDSLAKLMLSLLLNNKMSASFKENAFITIKRLYGNGKPKDDLQLIF